MPTNFSNTFSEADQSEITRRIADVLGETSYRQAAEITGVSHETIRRMVLGSNIGLGAVAAFCRGFEVSAEWLLFGTGPRRRKRRRPPSP
jgi:hypothetical protein